MSSHMSGFERDTLDVVLSGRRVWLVHVLANALLMIAFFYWTRIPEETGWQFALTIIGGFAIAFVTLWLHTATFDYFSLASERCFRKSLRSSVARIPAFLIWTVIFGFVLWLIGQLWDYDQQIGGWARHALPVFLRGRITPRTMFSASHWFVWFLYFFLWPILFFPVAAQVAVRNFRGFYSAAAFRPVREVRFWLTYLVCFVTVGWGFVSTRSLARRIAAHNTTHAVTSSRYPNPRRKTMLQVCSFNGEGLRGTIHASV